ncbi:MAG: Rab family GTPase [Candidatus Helarchaeota archaeon]
MIKDRYKFKIAILGEPNIGKSSLNALCTRHFDAETEEIHEKLYGVSFAVEVLQNVDIEISLVVWNLTGQDKYKNIQKRHLEGVSGVLLLFDLTNKSSFEKLPNWLEFIGLYIPNIPIILVGTKADLFYEKEISDDEIENFFNTFKLQGYSEVSFKTGLNFEQTIEMLADSVFKFRTLDKKTFKELKIHRYGNTPLILDEQKTIETISITIDTIIEIITKEITNEINLLKHQKRDIDNIELRQKFNRLIDKINGYDAKLEKINEQIPIISTIFYNQFNEWKNTKISLRKKLDTLLE